MNMAHFFWSNDENKSLSPSEPELSSGSIPWHRYRDFVQVNLGGKKLESLPEGLTQIQGLQFLHACDNKIKSVPTFLGQLKSLLSLDLEDNEITTLPDVFSQLSDLRELSLSNNRLETLPDSVSRLGQLTHLSLKNNCMKTLPSWIGSLRELRRLSVIGNQLSYLPEEICDLPKLESLEVSGNRLTRLPDCIGKIRELRYLDVEANQLDSLPADIVNLENLVRLEASRNFLTSLPAENFDRLQRLEILNLDGNGVLSLPRSARRLTNLKDVTLSVNLPDVCYLANITNDWDVFVSHASEDKEAVVIPICKLLQRAGLRVWLDVSEIKLGDSIRARIDEGLARSRFGVVVLSPAFLAKKWTSNELGALFALEDEGQRRLLPVWHNLTFDEIRAKSPLLADRAAANTSDGSDAVAARIVDTVLYRAHGNSDEGFLTETQLLARMIGVSTPASAIVSFLASHPNIVLKSFGIRGDAELELLNSLSALIAIDNMLSLRRAEHNLVYVCNPVEPVFRTESKLNGEVLHHCREIKRLFAAPVNAFLAGRGRAAEERPFDYRSRRHPMGSPLQKAWGRAFIIAGRRMNLTEGMKGILRSLANTHEGKIAVRSYDWFLNVSMDGVVVRARRRSADDALV
jgi:Leucine-rich repeat (LRR) protein